MIRASIARYAVGWTVLVVHCPACGWSAEISTRRLQQAVAHPCTRQLQLKEDR